MLTAQAIMSSWAAFGRPEALQAASRYELEKAAHALWQEILANEDVDDAIVEAHASLRIELKLRQRS